MQFGIESVDGFTDAATRLKVGRTQKNSVLELQIRRQNPVCGESRLTYTTQLPSLSYKSSYMLFFDEQVFRG